MNLSFQPPEEDDPRDDDDLARSDELPPLPTPDIWVREDFGLGDWTTHEGYTADQMRAYAQEAARQEREAAAKACEDFGASYDNEWNRKLGVANDLKDACEECAAAIRSRSSTTGEAP